MISMDVIAIDREIVETKAYGREHTLMALFKKK